MSSVSSGSFALVARDLARSFADHVVLDGVDVTVGPRTRLGVVGPNGVGKTTLLRLLAGLDRPERGSVTRTPPALRVGYLPQERERRSDETVYAFLERRTGVADADAAFARARPPNSRRARPAPTTRTPPRSSSTSRRAPRTSTPGPERPRPTWGSTKRCSSGR